MIKEGFLTDFKRIQKISGIAAASGILMTLTAIFLFPISSTAKTNIIYVCAGTALFAIVYYLIPGLYLNKKIAYIPDLVYVTAITITMQNLGQYGKSYFIFYMILAAVDAFIFPLYQYAIVIFGMLLGLFLVNPSLNYFFSADYLYEAYGLLALAVILYLIGKEVLSMKERRDFLEDEIKELENDKREIRNLLESIADGMFVVNANNKITFYNSAALSLLGVVAHKEKVLGKNLSDFLPTLGPKGAELPTDEAIKTKKPRRRDDFRIVLPHQTLQLHTNTTPVLNEKGAVSGAIVFFRDISREKRVEEGQSEFAAVASHELRNPLSILEGYLYFLLEPDSGAKYNKLTKDYLEKAHQASKDLIHLITDILTVVKTEENTLEINLEEVAVSELAKKVTDRFKASAKEKGLILSYKSKTKIEINTDRVKFQEILSNLIENAIKFTERGRVAVEVGELENEVVISVTDTGKGIAEADLPMIFHKFYRTEDWCTRETNGTGLGLFIAKSLTKRLGGRIGVQSEKDKGSRFFFSLPKEAGHLKINKKALIKKKTKEFVTSF